MLEKQLKNIGKLVEKYLKNNWRKKGKIHAKYMQKAGKIFLFLGITEGNWQFLSRNGQNQEQSFPIQLLLPRIYFKQNYPKCREATEEQVSLKKIPP